MRSIPVSRSRIISRQRLLDQLQHHSGLRLINVIAPAGYGKTTLVAAWAQSLAAMPAERRDSAWITLFGDAEPEQLLRDILQALLPALPSLQSILNFAGGATDAEDALAQRVRMLCAEIAAVAHPVVLVIDDYHLLKSPQSHALIQRILDFAPHGLLLVLCSRTMPPLRIDALILDDAILTLTERNLAFDHADFTALLPLFGLDSLPLAVLDDLERRCAGWVTGLKLFAYDLRITHASASRAFPADASASASDGALQQFIEARVLASMPAHLQEFACAAAPLLWMSADLMAAVTDASRADCARTLSELVAANAFLSEFIGADGEPRFRFHPLVQDALRHTAADRPQQPCERRRAAAWFLAHDDVDAALLLLAPDIDPADFADDLARAMRRALVRSEFTSVQRWLNALPAALLDAHAPLAVATAWTAFLTESLSQLETAIPRAQTALSNHDGTDVELRLDVAVLSAYLHSLHNRTEDAAEELAAVEAYAQPTDTLGYGYLQFMRALRLLSAPNEAETRIRLLQTAAELFERIGHDQGVIAMRYTQVMLKFRNVDLHGALADAAFLQGFCEHRHMERHRYVSEIPVMRGWMLYLLDRIPEARDALRRTVDLPAHHDLWENTRYLAGIHLQLCAAAESSDPAAVLNGIDEMADAARWVRAVDEANFNGTLGQVAWPRILRDHRAGHPERCRQTVESMGMTPADIDDQTPDFTRVAVLSGAVLGGQHSPQLAAQLDASIAHLDAAHAVFMAMHVRLLSVLHFLQHGGKREALDRLRALLPLVERSGAVRLLLDFPALRELLPQCDSPFAHQLLARFPAPPTDFGLTPQETRVLTHLVDGRTTKEIATLHVVSHKTVYVQLYRIFKKLGVHSREEAVQMWQRQAEKP